MMTFTTVINTVLEFLAKALQQEKETEHSIGMKEVKLSSFADYMVLELEKSKDSTKNKLLELINSEKLYRIKNICAFIYLVTLYSL